MCLEHDAELYLSLCVQRCAETVHQAVGDAGVRSFVSHHVQKPATEPMGALFVALLACRSAPASLCLALYVAMLHPTEFAGKMLQSTGMGRAGLLMLRKPLRRVSKARRQLRRQYWMCRCGTDIAMWTSRSKTRSLARAKQDSEVFAHCPQEAAMRVGHKAESLPLWDEFALLYQRHTEALAGLIATADVAEHLTEVATLCSESRPLLSSWFTDLATLVSTDTPGELTLNRRPINAFA